MCNVVAGICNGAAESNDLCCDRAAGGLGLRCRSEWRDAASGGERIQDRHRSASRHQSDSTGHCHYFHCLYCENQFRGIYCLIHSGLCPDASWEPGDCTSQSTGVGSAQEVVWQVSFLPLLNLVLTTPQPSVALYIQVLHTNMIFLTCEDFAKYLELSPTCCFLFFSVWGSEKPLSVWGNWGSTWTSSTTTTPRFVSVFNVESFNLVHNKQVIKCSHVH